MVTLVFESLQYARYSEYLKSLFSVRNSIYCLRGTNILILPKPRPSKYGLYSIAYYAVKMWNLLDDHLRTITEFQNFRLEIRDIDFYS